MGTHRKEMNKNPDAILFDLDGVLIDSEGLYTRFWDVTEKQFPTGIPDFAHYIKGTNLDSILLLFKPEERDEILRRILDFDRHLQYPMFPGAEELLQFLQEREIPAALVTSSNPEKMEQLFAQYPRFKNYFGCIVNGSMVTKSKPDPEGYLLAARLLGKDISRCVVVEDSLQGIRAGRAAGAEVWALSTTLPASDIISESPQVYADIQQVFQKLKNS